MPERRETPWACQLPSLPPGRGFQTAAQGGEPKQDPGHLMSREVQVQGLQGGQTLPHRVGNGQGPRRRPEGSRVALYPVRGQWEWDWEAKPPENSWSSHRAGSTSPPARKESPHTAREAEEVRISRAGQIRPRPKAALGLPQRSFRSLKKKSLHVTCVPDKS